MASCSALRSAICGAKCCDAHPAENRTTAERTLLVAPRGICLTLGGVCQRGVRALPTSAGLQIVFADLVAELPRGGPELASGFGLNVGVLA